MIWYPHMTTTDISATGHSPLTAPSRALVWIVLVVALLAPCRGLVFAAEPARPNIVLILADDVGREAIGCYGGRSYATPHIDQLAQAGLRFRHCYAMPVCHPTRVCLLTGRYPIHLGNPHWGTFPREAEKQTVAWALRKAGYATAVAGKWQLALLKDHPRHPARLGFQEWCLFGWHEGPRYYRPRIWQNGKLRTDVADRYGPDVYADFLVDFITRHRDRPFFAYYPMALCHDVTDDLDAPVPFGPRGRYDNFHEMVEAMDARVGRLVAAIDRLGLAKRTLILFTTDNGSPQQPIVSVRDGQYVYEKVVSQTISGAVPGGKGELTDAGTRVPTIARWPGVVPAGRATDALVDLSDILPTLADLAGAALPSGVAIDGKSFAPQLRGVEGGRRWVFAQHKGKSWVRTRRWKLYDDGRLFDMAADPREQAPLSPENDSPEAAAARAMLRRVQQGLSLPKAAAAPATVHDAIVEASEAARLSMQFSGNTAADLEAWQRAFRSKLAELLGDVAPPDRWRVREEDRVVLPDHTRYQLLLEAHGIPSVPIYLLVPKDAKAGERRPAVLCVHGHGPFGNDPVVGRIEGPDGAPDHDRQQAIARAHYDYGLQFVRRGYVVAAPCLIPFGRRVDRSAYGGTDPCATTFVRMQALGQLPIAANLRDLRWCIDFLESRSEVDPRRIGCAGLSYGGRMTMLAAAMDRRIRVAAVSGALNLLQERIQARYSCGSQIIPGLLKYGDFSEIGSLIAPRPCVWEVGAHDRLVVPEWDQLFKQRLERAYRAAGHPERLRFDHFEGPHRWNGAVAYPLFDAVLKRAE